MDCRVRARNPVPEPSTMVRCLPTLGYARFGDMPSVDWPEERTLMRLKGQGSNTGLLLLGIIVVVAVAALAYFLVIAPR